MKISFRRRLFRTVVTVVSIAVTAILTGCALRIRDVATSSALKLGSNAWVANGPVYSMRSSGGILYIGGSFTQVGPNLGSGVILDPLSGAQTTTTLANYVNGSVLAAISDGAGGWYIGGSFTQVGGVIRNNLVSRQSMKSRVTSRRGIPIRT